MKPDEFSAADRERIQRWLSDDSIAFGGVGAVRRLLAAYDRIATGVVMADAARYRWLREAAQTTDFTTPRWTVAKEHGGCGQVYRGEQLDAAIDAAMVKPEAA